MRILDLSNFLGLSFNLQNQNTPFQYIYALGDSLTDTGNAYIASYFAEPDPDAYFRGRFSSGPTWVEYLSEALGTKLISYAYAGATSDRVAYPVPYEKVPGCLQQADFFIRDYNIMRSTDFFSQTLASVSFFGNDFHNLNATAEISASNIDACLRKIINNTDVRDFVVLTTLEPKLYPFFTIMPDEVILGVSKITKEYCQLISIKLRNLRREFPHITFYEIDYGNLLTSLVNQTISLPQNNNELLEGSCIPVKADDPNSNKAIPCNNPSQYIFHDGIHPTTGVHQAISDMVLWQILYPSRYRYF